MYERNMEGGSQSEEEVYIPLEDFRRVLEQNKRLQETHLRLEEENGRLVEENRSMLEELEVTSALIHMLEQRNTELVTVQAKEDRDELLCHLALVEEEMVNLKTQYELVVLALDQERAMVSSRDIEITALRRLISDESKDAIISSLGRRIAELERQTTQKSSCAQSCDTQEHQSCSPLCYKSLSLCVENDVIMLQTKSHILELFDLLERNRFRVASEMLTDLLLNEKKNMIASLNNGIMKNNAVIMKLLHQILDALTNGKEPAVGATDEIHSETLCRFLNSIRDAYLIERSNLLEQLNHINFERTQILNVFGLDIARLGQLRDDLAEQRFHSTLNLL